jgi:hypothetical protein
MLKHDSHQVTNLYLVFRHDLLCINTSETRTTFDIKLLQILHLQHKEIADSTKWTEPCYYYDILICCEVIRIITKEKYVRDTEYVDYKQIMYTEIICHTMNALLK